MNLALRSLIAGAAVAALAFTPAAARAVTHASNYETNLENYRVCVGDDPTATCEYNDTRSPSLWHISGGTKGTAIHMGTGAVKLRIDSIVLDDTHPTWACTSQSFTCATEAGNNCGSGKRCQAGPKDGDCCLVDGDCQALACDGGLVNDQGCNNNTDCEKVDGTSGWSLVFDGTHANAKLAFNPTRIVFENENCTKTCDFALETAGSAHVGTVDLSSLSCTLSASCAVGVSAFHSVYVVDPNGDIMALPGIGNAIISGALDDGDPAKLGDACRTQNPPPADCP